MGYGGIMCNSLFMEGFFMKIGMLLLILHQIVQQGEGMLVKNYGKKHGAGGMFFNAIICLFSMVFFFVTDKDGLHFPKELFLYGFVSCLMFATGFYSMYLALKLGSYAMSKLFASFSGIIAIAYGIVFLREPSNFITYTAIVLVFISVFLMNYKKEKDSAEKGFSLKWFLAVLATVISNGLIAVLQKAQQLKFHNGCDNEFMILSLGGAFVALFVLGLILEREKLGQIIKHGTLYGAGAGLMNGAMNFLNLAVYIFIPISAATSIRTGLSIVGSFAVSVLIYREKFTLMQALSAGVGIIALLLLQFNTEILAFINSIL